MNSREIELAFRARIEALVCATTGPAALAAVANGYTRAAGSFVDDGFVAGMELTPAGFTTATPALVTEVTALRLTVAGVRTAQAAAAGRSLVVGLPADRVYDNEPYTPKAGRAYVETDFLVQPSAQLSAPYAGGTREDRGLYVVRLFTAAGTGGGGLRACCDALMALFAPGTTIPLASGRPVRVRGDSGPFLSQILNRSAGHAFAELTIPWRRYAVNAVTA